MSSDQGAPSIDARVVIGAMVIKQKLKLDDREVVETIRENVYLQYFLGLSAYTAEALFDRSLFTTFRYRLGHDKFDQMSQRIIAKALNLCAVQSDQEEQGPAGGPGLPDKDGISETAAAQPGQNDGIRKGKLKVDATVADQMIKYQTGLDLLLDSREQSERMIDQLSALLKLTKSPVPIAGMPAGII